MSATGGPNTSSGSDPLVPRDVNDWTLNVYGILKRSGRRIAVVSALWGLIPAAGSGWMMNRLLSHLERINTIAPPGTAMTAQRSERLTAAFGDLLATAGLWFAVSLVLAYFLAAGWAASLRVAVTDAAGQRIGLGAAMAYGARRGLNLWAWYAPVSVGVLIGSILCVLPGLYLAVAFALFAPVALFEGGAAPARSFALVHKRFGRTLGRIMLSFAAVFVTGLVLYVIQSLLAGAGLGSTGLSASGPLDLAVDGVFALANAVLTAVILVSGLLVTYAEAAAVEGGPANTSQLVERSSV